MKNIMVTYEAEATIKLRGTVSIPKRVWDEIPEGEAWSDEVEDRVKLAIDFYAHVQQCDDEDIEIEDVVEVK